jgi:hypothetical protein
LKDSIERGSLADDLKFSYRTAFTLGIGEKAKRFIIRIRFVRIARIIKTPDNPDDLANDEVYDTVVKTLRDYIIICCSESSFIRGEYSGYIAPYVVTFVR